VISRKIISLFCCCFLVLTVSAQQLIKSFTAVNDFITTDNIGNLYVIKADEIRQFTANGDYKIVFSDKSLGSVSAFDGSNALKLLVFYKDLSQLIFLDNNLGQRGNKLSLEQHNFQQTISVCSSHSNGIWLFDQVNFELVRLDQQFKIMLRTGNLMQVLGYGLNPVFMVEVGNWLYLADPEKGILVFDVFGTYYKTIPLFNVDVFYIVKDFLFYKKANEIVAFNLKSLQEQAVYNAEMKVKSFCVQKQRLYVSDGTTIRMYNLNL
jgi:hypothetical protein